MVERIIGRDVPGEIKTNCFKCHKVQWVYTYNMDTLMTDGIIICEKCEVK